MIFRSHYRRKKPYFLPLVIILLAVFISFTALRGLFGVKSLLQTAFYPFQVIGVSIWKGVTGVPSAILNLRSLSRQNAELRKEIRSLEAGLLILEEQSSENLRLRKALRFVNSRRYNLKLLPAQVIGKSPAPWYSILQINQGSKSGIKKGMAVLVEEGLAGEVLEVSAFTSKVLLIIDAESSVAAMDSRSRDFGVVRGGSGNRLYMRYVSAGGDVREGDKIVTSIISSIFPPGIPIGEIVQASKREHDLFYHIEIKPAVDFSRIEEVFVIL